MKIIFYSSILIFLVTCFTNSCTSVKNLSREQNTKTHLNKQLDSLINHLQGLEQLVIQSASNDELKKQFMQSRFKYKQIESFVEYYFQGLTKKINGPALPDVKTEDGQVLPPQGFQVIEEHLYSDEKLDKKLIINEIRLLLTDLRFVKKNLEIITILNRHINEAIQHQFIRIATLGITGFDAPISLLSIEEAQHSVLGIHQLFKNYYQDTLSSQLLKKIELHTHKATTYLQKNQNFDKFNRMEFIQDYLMPTSEAYLEATKKFRTSADSIFENSFFRGSLSDLFKGKGFNPDAFSPYQEAKSNPYKIQLGEKLFYEKKLSKNQSMSCGSCHQANLAFTDGLKKAANLVHGGNLARNTPSIFYSALQNSQFYDMRSGNLEDQVDAVMKNSEEFNLNVDKVAQKLLEQNLYKKLFLKAFPQKQTITSFEIRNAIASYVRSLNLFNSRFDTYLKGNKKALNKSEINGFNLFAGKAKCATCHFLPVFNGTIPPWFNKTESEVIGVPQSPLTKQAKIDTDLGRYNLNKFEELRHAFKTPTIRNIEYTAPYMHNGVYDNLAQVIEFYNLGGGKGIGISLENQTLPEDKLNLSDSEQKDLIAFLKTLSDIKQTQKKDLQ